MISIKLKKNQKHQEIRSIVENQEEKKKKPENKTDNKTPVGDPDIGVTEPRL